MSKSRRVSEYPLTKSEAKQYLDGQIKRGTSTSYGTAGALMGWRQMRRDLVQMRSDVCRSDAVGRLSKSDIAVLDAAIADYRDAGKIGPEWNGFLTMR